MHIEFTTPDQEHQGFFKVYEYERGQYALEGCEIYCDPTRPEYSEDAADVLGDDYVEDLYQRANIITSKWGELIIDWKPAKR